MKKFFRVAGPLIVGTLLLIGGWFLVKDAYFPTLDPSGDVAKSERDIFWFTVILSSVVVIPVWIMLITFSLRYRKDNKKAVYKPEWAKNTWLEVVWWGIPILIIATLATVVVITTHQLDPYKKIVSDKNTVEVQVVALEWKWLFIYPDEGIASVNELMVPVNTPIHFTLAADAPMSAFWVPALGSQIYTMNGMSSQLNLIGREIGTFKGYNTNIAGEGYAKMTFDVPVVRDSKFREWINEGTNESRVLDWKAYQELSKQSVVDKPILYKLGDADMYHKILMKYMSPMDNGRDSNQHDHNTTSDMGNDSMEEMNDMSDMENMTDMKGHN